MRIRVDQHVFPQNRGPVALNLEDAAAKRRSVEVHAKHQPLVLPIVRRSDVLPVEVGVNRSKQRLDGGLELLPPEDWIHRGFGFLNERVIDPAAMGALEAPALPSGCVLGTVPKLAGEVAATGWSGAEHHSPRVVPSIGSSAPSHIS